MMPSFIVERVLLFFHSYPCLLFGLFESTGPSRKIKEDLMAEVRGASEANDTSHPHFVLIRAPPWSVLWRGLSHFLLLVRKAPSFLSSPQRMSEGQKFSTP